MLVTPVRIRSLLFSFLAVMPCFAQDEAEASAEAAAVGDGPAIAYEDAFPAQEAFVQPLFVAFHETDPGSAYVVTQPGQILRIPRDGAKSEREVFFDLGDRVLTKNWEEGLLGFQFDPGYARNRFVWTYWSEKIEAREEAQARGKRKSNRQSVIARYTVKLDDGRPVVDLATELRVMEVFQPFGNHNGGTICFGPDRMLYIALGDGGYKNDIYGNAESLAMLLGKVLRVDVSQASATQPYAIPADNPFVATAGARGEIWCYGLRNVWRMSFDRQTGKLWAADVGQNKIEEVDVLVKGGFYGWNTFEARDEFDQRRSKLPTPDGHIEPIASYTHREGLSITGGYVYRGKKIPALQGFFVYSDFITKRAWACKEGAGGAHTVVRVKNTPFPPSSYAEEPDGELLMTCFMGKKGKIFRLVPGSE